MEHVINIPHPHLASEKNRWGKMAKSCTVPVNL